jgi:hypothetical protein
MPLEPTLTLRVADSPPPATTGRNEDLRSLVLSPLTYVPRGGWPAVFETLAGDCAELRSANGDPNATLISTIAGLDRARLTALKTLQFGLGKKVMEALVTFMVVIHGHTRAQAEAELWDLVEADEAESAVAA